MNNPARKQPAPPSAGQLAERLADIERVLLDTKRANATARGALGAHLASGDAEAISECRREIKRTAAEVREFSEAVEAQREAIEIAQQRERTGVNARAHENIRQAVARQVKRAEELERCADALGAALMEFRKGLDATDAVMRAAGVEPDPYALRAVYGGTLDIRLHIATDGLYGQRRTLESRHQIEQAGRDSLRRLAADYQTLCLRRAQAALRINPE